MILYLDARTTVKDLIIDYIEVVLGGLTTVSVPDTKGCILERSMPMADWSSCRI